VTAKLQETIYKAAYSVKVRPGTSHDFFEDSFEIQPASDANAGRATNGLAMEAKCGEELINAVKLRAGERQAGPELGIPYGHIGLVKATGFLERCPAKERGWLDKDA
jgi:hypothetical protein